MGRPEQRSPRRTDPRRAERLLAARGSLVVHSHDAHSSTAVTGKRAGSVVGAGQLKPVRCASDVSGMDPRADRGRGLVGPNPRVRVHSRGWWRWTASPGEELGGTSPPYVSPDVRTWEGAPMLAVQSRAWLLVPFLAVWVVAGDSLERAGYEVVLSAAALALFAYMPWAWLRRGGWIAIDPGRRELSWHRPPRRPEPTARWRFDEVERVGLFRTLGEPTLRLRVAGRRFALKVPKGDEGRELVASLRAVVAEAAADSDRA